MVYDQEQQRGYSLALHTKYQYRCLPISKIIAVISVVHVHQDVHGLPEKPMVAHGPQKVTKKYKAVSVNKDPKSKNRLKTVPHITKRPLKGQKCIMETKFLCWVTGSQTRRKIGKHFIGLPLLHRQKCEFLGI